MSNYCYPLLEASICSKNVLIAFSANDCIMSFKRKGQTCRVEIQPLNGEIFLTDTEILEFFDNANIFTISLVDDTFTNIPINYIDCQGNFESANTVKIQFSDCEFDTDTLFEVCDL